MSLDLKNLATQLSSLDGEQALALLDSIHALTAKAEKARAEQAQAEAELAAQTMVCACGRPITHVKYLICHSTSVRLGIEYKRGVKRGGFIASICDSHDDTEGLPEDVARMVDTAAWFTCDNLDDCGVWTRTDNAIAAWVD